MDKIWANRLLAGTKTWEDIAKVGRISGVKAELFVRRENGGLSTEEYDRVMAEAPL